MRRINLFGGPGVGKSTLALWLTQEFRRCGVFAELVDEWIKRWAYENRVVDGWDQYGVFNNQLEKEYFFLKHNVSVIITDSPLVMQTAYMKNSDSERFIPLCLAAAKMFEENYHSLNIFLERGDVPYDPVGRWQKTLDEAVEVDKSIKCIMEENLHDFYEFNVRDWDGILKECMVRLGCLSC